MSPRIQPPHLEVLTECAAGRTRVLNRVLDSLYSDALRPLGLSPNQLTLLALIETLDRPRSTDLEPYLLADPSTLSRTLNRMRDNGWLVTLAVPDDARSHAFRLTAKGRRLLRDAMPAWRRAQAEARAMVGPARLNAIRQAADRLLDL